MAIKVTYNGGGRRRCGRNIWQNGDTHTFSSLSEVPDECLDNPRWTVEQPKPRKTAKPKVTDTPTPTLEPGPKDVT